ncbi:Hypothetical protein R9X50_00351800 [Acrodontium crateriforme]|uniref:GOLD domain-containing protein n=1 Tax=Acrodontium crateriforme TaxID=150365 RepID=A0AAQ3RBX1_9PEZI|nr:Hypothetical protein R9X50_00351800 [Acrodontium crateriforme]
MRSLAGILSVAALCVAQAQALYVYFDGHHPKCFYEELPKDTLVTGKYKATAWDEQARAYVDHPEMGVYISVDETFDNMHRVVSNRGASSGKFTFSAADSGDHRLCFLPNGIPPSVTFHPWTGQQIGGIKLELDIVIGETSQIERSDKGKIDEMVQKVKDLRSRLDEVRREQIFQREREADFRDQSEAVNARVVRWTVIQMLVLTVTCAWQLTYLRAFFIKQKLT